MVLSLDYIAGFVDADGCIGIYKRKPSISGRTVNPSYAPELTVANTYEPLLLALKEQFGGFITYDSRNGHCARWGVSCKQAESLLTALVPRLQIKYQQAILCLELIALIGNGSRILGSNRTVDSEVAQRERLYQRCKELNSGSYGKKNNY